MYKESEFTRPSPECPHPEHWNSPDAYAAESEVTTLVRAMVRALQPELVIETGTHTGNTARAIGKALLANGHGWLVSLEIDPVSAETARANCKDLPVTVITGSSLTYIPDGPVDFMWLDSSLQHRVREYERFRRSFSQRAVVMVHDAGPKFELGADLRKLRDVQWVFLPTPRGVAIGRPSFLAAAAPEGPESSPEGDTRVFSPPLGVP